MGYESSSVFVGQKCERGTRKTIPRQMIDCLDMVLLTGGQDRQNTADKVRQVGLQQN